MITSAPPTPRRRAWTSSSSAARCSSGGIASTPPARGHRVTLFNRGTRPEVFADVEQLHGDRDGDLSVLAGRRWDAVIDTSGYVPRVVGAMAKQLTAAVDRYVFVSSVSVYADFDVDLVAEDAPVAVLDDPTTEDVPAHYGA